MLNKLLESDQAEAVITLVVIVSMSSYISRNAHFGHIVGHPFFVSTAVFAFMYSQTKNPLHASLAGIITTVLLYVLRSVEGFTLMSVRDTEILPGCKTTSVKDLVDLFDGNEKALKEAMYKAGVPLSVPLTDANAPTIATHLVYYGKEVNESCKKPM